MKYSHFIVKSEIKTKARPRATIINGHAMVYTPKDTLYYENYVKQCYKEQCDNFFKDMPMSMDIIFYFKPSKDLEKLIKETETDPREIECVKHKDLDNLAKAVLDGLNGVAFTDDKNIVDLNLTKRYTDKEYEYVDVTIYEKPTLTLDDLKKHKEIIKLRERERQLKSKEKLNTSERIRLEQIERHLKELI